MHRGIQDLDSESDLEGLLQLTECDDFTYNDPNARFTTYFFEIGYSDDFLLCSNGGGICDPRDDQDFINNLQNYDITDDRYISLARESNDFDDFCASIIEENKDINDLFITLEPFLFDWRNEIMHVKISCELHDDDWSRDGDRVNSTVPQNYHLS